MKDKILTFRYRVSVNGGQLTVLPVKKKPPVVYGRGVVGYDGINHQVIYYLVGEEKISDKQFEEVFVELLAKAQNKDHVIKFIPLCIQEVV